MRSHPKLSIQIWSNTTKNSRSIDLNISLDESLHKFTMPMWDYSGTLLLIRLNNRIFQHLTCVISNRGTLGKCNGDKKHCCFHWELNYGLTLGLKQRWYIYGTIKGIISNFRIVFFFTLFLIFLKIRIPPCSPVRYNKGHFVN